MTSPTQELVDVVDAKDAVVKTVTRAEAYASQSRHRVVHIYVENAAGDILVQWRHRSKTNSPRQFTASVAGTVAAGEDYLTAAKREMNEELGLKGKKLTEVTKIKLSKVEGEAERFIQIYAATHNGEVSNWEEEAEVIDYWNVEEAAYMLQRYPYLLTRGFEKSLETYLKWRAKHPQKS